MTKASQAEVFLREPNNYRDTNAIMNALDALDLKKDQDWENETTTWTFDDGSIIQVCNNEVDLIGS